MCKVDGSVCAWDLREPPALHKSVHYENSDHLLRYPTYNTGKVITEHLTFNVHIYMYMCIGIYAMQIREQLTYIYLNVNIQ